MIMSYFSDFGCWRSRQTAPLDSVDALPPQTYQYHSYLRPTAVVVLGEKIVRKCSRLVPRCFRGDCSTIRPSSDVSRESLRMPGEKIVVTLGVREKMFVALGGERVQMFRIYSTALRASGPAGGCRERAAGESCRSGQGDQARGKRLREAAEGHVFFLPRHPLLRRRHTVSLSYSTTPSTPSQTYSTTLPDLLHYTLPDLLHYTIDVPLSFRARPHAAPVRALRSLSALIVEHACPRFTSALGLLSHTLVYTAGRLEIWQIDDLRGVPILAPATLAGWAPVREHTMWPQVPRPVP